jgi:membrane protease YdiL (CAAX protease family)
VTTPPIGGGRIRAYLEFLTAVIYYFLARSMARHAAASLANEAWYPFAEQAVLVFLLILGYALFGQLFDRQKSPVAEQGLPLRPGWRREAELGLALGWGAALVCALLLVLVGGIAIVLSTQSSALAWLLVDVAFFALMAMAEEVAFRGYGFQRLAGVVGPIGATLGFAGIYAVVQALQPGSSRVSIVVSVVFTVLLSTAYLRTRALWLSWGLNFGWKASRALIFGLAVSGISGHSSVIEGDPMGPFWMSGGGYGLDGSWVAGFVLLAALPVLYRVTRDLDFQHNAPVIVPRGIPVDLDTAARLQHEAQMGPVEPNPSPFVQILPAPAPSASNPAEKVPGTKEDSPH